MLDLAFWILRALKKDESFWLGGVLLARWLYAILPRGLLAHLRSAGFGVDQLY
jgi:DNA-directed RNA polymerase specialized sigma24 family protein